MCQEGRALQLSAAAGSPQEKRRRRGGSECPSSARVLFSHRGGDGGASHFSSSSTRPYRCPGTVSGERHRWENALDSSSQGGGGALGGAKSKFYSGQWYGGGGESCVGACVLSLLRRNGCRVIRGIDEKGVCCPPPPHPPAILVSRSFHIQRGYSLCAAVCTCGPSGLRASGQRAKTGDAQDTGPHSGTLLIMAILLKGTLGT